MNEQLKSKLHKLEDVIGYHFKDLDLLKVAVSHTSYVNELRVYKWESYQRMEYLGDAVLELVISDYLYRNNPDMSEGVMSKTRSSIVCETALSYCARKINLSEYILLGIGEAAAGGADRDSILSDVFESIIGAIYLDGGYDKAKDHIYAHVVNEIGDTMVYVDNKSMLQEIMQSKHIGKIEYSVISEKGPEHKKVFEVALVINGKQIVIAQGKNKKKAEQRAAFEAIKMINEYGLLDGGENEESSKDEKPENQDKDDKKE